jgi:hypothetical protein
LGRGINNGDDDSEDDNDESEDVSVSVAKQNVVSRSQLHVLNKTEET